MNLRRALRVLVPLALVACWGVTARANVARIEIASRADVVNGKAWGNVGPYERIIGKVYFTVDPKNPHNKIIPNIDKAPRDAQGLGEATPSQLQEIEISPSGFGIHFPKLDADLYLPAILQGFLGSRKWMASRLGQAGGKSRSVAKQKASRANGKLGGRPGKVSRGGL